MVHFITNSGTSSFAFLHQEMQIRLIEWADVTHVPSKSQICSIVVNALTKTQKDWYLQSRQNKVPASLGQSQRKLLALQIPHPDIKRQRTLQIWQKKVPCIFYGLQLCIQERQWSSIYFTKTNATGRPSPYQPSQSEECRIHRLLLPWLRQRYGIQWWWSCILHRGERGRGGASVLRHHHASQWRDNTGARLVLAVAKEVLQVPKVAGEKPTSLRGIYRRKKGHVIGDGNSYRLV